MNREADRKEQTERQAEAEGAGGAGSNGTGRRGTGRDRQERKKQRGGERETQMVEVKEQVALLPKQTILQVLELSAWDFLIVGS